MLVSIVGIVTAKKTLRVYLASSASDDGNTREEDDCDNRELAL